MGKRLLILMDSEPVTSRALALDLSDAGYQVDTAEDGPDALRKLETTPFDLLIATEGLDEEGGIVARMRSVRPAAKVLLMTTDTDRARRGPRSGEVVRVRKPFDLEEFRSLVERLLDRNRNGA